MQDQTKIFLARVLAWPQDGDPVAYGNIHYTFTPKDLRSDRTGKPIYPWAGRAYKDASSAASMAAFFIANKVARDIYFCTSTQTYAENVVSQKGKPYLKAHRSQENVAKMKSLFIDIDLNEGKADQSKGYETSKDLSAALSKFLKDTGLPKPTIMVFSGGGVHVYWTLMNSLTLEEWLPLAYALAEATKREGLKCDSGCTIDAARVLRVPGTLNHKYDPPRPVKMLGEPVEYDYVNSKIEAILTPYKVKVPQATQNSSLALFPAKAPVSNDLGAGIDMSSMAPIKLDSLVGQCGFIEDALMTGGASYNQPLWNLTTLIATFTEGGRIDAHRMSSGHVNYGPGETDELFDRKEGERQSGKLGWPRCAAISAAGCTSCATCPLLAQNKSPLNFAAKVTMQGNNGQPVGGFTTPNVPSTTTAHLLPGTSTADPDLPDGYLRATNGVITKAEVQEDGNTIWNPISKYPMTDPFLERDPWKITFTTQTEHGKRSQVCAHLEACHGVELRKELQSQGLMIGGNLSDLRKMAEFMSSWIQKLQETAGAVITSVPFGWASQGGKVKGFVYDGIMFTSQGNETAPNTDVELARQYSPHGDIQFWLDAATMITDQKRPSLDALVASAFAGPLVKFTGHSGLLMSAYSQESGIGKSSALKVAQAVWGNPVKAIQSLSDTQNSVLHKLGLLKSIPMFWDELKTDEDTKRFIDTVFRLTLGKEKSRMTSKVEQRAVGTWETMLVSASNDSLVDGVAFKSKSSTAGIYRVFEFTVPPAAANGPGQIPTSMAQRIISKLHDNYGAVGRAYAEFLGTNHVQVEGDVALMMRLVEHETKTKPDERFWVATIAAVLQGAAYANQRGYTNINEVALKEFLYVTLDGMRGIRQSTNVDMRQQHNVVGVVAKFLKEHTRNTVRTNKIHRSKGRPPVGDINVLCDLTKIDGCSVHIGEDDKILRFSKDDFNAWCVKSGHGGYHIQKAVIDELGATLGLARLASGVPSKVTMSMMCYEINLAKTPLMNFIDEA